MYTLNTSDVGREIVSDRIRRAETARLVRSVRRTTPTAAVAAYAGPVRRERTVFGRWIRRFRIASAL